MEGKITQSNKGPVMTIETGESFLLGDDGNVVAKLDQGDSWEEFNAKHFPRFIPVFKIR
jgi:hypothetical protein